MWCTFWKLILTALPIFILFPPPSHYYILIKSSESFWQPLRKRLHFDAGENVPKILKAEVKYPFIIMVKAEITEDAFPIANKNSRVRKHVKFYNDKDFITINP